MITKKEGEVTVLKKFILALFLSAGLCMAGLQTDAIASEPSTAQEKDTEVQKEYVDLSDQIIQEGGFPKEPPSSVRRMRRSAVVSTKEEQVQDILTEVWDSLGDSCDLSAYRITREELNEIYTSTINMHPRYFYVGGSYSFYSDPYSGFVTKVVEISYKVDKSTALQQIKAYDSAVADALRNADSSWSDMEKALYVNDYLARNCAYDETYQRHEAYDALVDGTAVCQGYALAFFELARELGLSCEMVTSHSLNHAWNMVKIGNSYYHVDVTWNDPIHDRLGRARHLYFMKSTSFFKKDKSEGFSTHLEQEDWVISNGITDDAAADSTYDDYFWNDVNVGFDYIENAWYGFNAHNGISRYNCEAMQFKEDEPLITIKDIWEVLDGSGGWWKGNFGGTGSFDGKYFYSGSDAIYSLDVNTKEKTEIFKLSDTQKQNGRVYGINITSSGKLQYILAEAPDKTGTIYTVKELQSTETKKNLYKISFNGNGADGGSMEKMISLKSGEDYNLPVNKFVKEGVQFKEWNTKRDGSGKCYKDEDIINYQAASNGERITLYAQWEEHVHGKTEVRGKKEATCQTEGYTGDEYCLECGRKVLDGEAIEKLPHTIIVDDAIEATCTEDGKTEGKHCKVCGDIIVRQVTISAKGHEWNEDYTVDKPATETEEGQKSIHCKRCDEIKDILSIPVIEAGHEHVAIVDKAIEATCTGAGKTEGKHCEICGAILVSQKIIEALGHEWDEEYTIDIEPTTEIEGQKSIHCTRCDARRDICPIPVLEAEHKHEPVVDAAIEATCIKDGKTEGSHCKICHEVLKEQQTIPTLGHDWNNIYTVDIKPTTEYEGQESIHCKRCDARMNIRSLSKLTEVKELANSIRVTERFTKTSKTKAQTFSLNARAAGGVLTYQSDNKNVRVDNNGRVTLTKNFVGKAVITVRAGGKNYASAVKRVTVIVNPSKIAAPKVKNTSGRKMQVKWKKSAQGSAYQIQYATKRSFSNAKSKNIKGAAKTSKTFAGLKKNKTYYVRVRTYKKVGDATYYSAWSGIKKVKIKK